MRRRRDGICCEGRCLSPSADDFSLEIEQPLVRSCEQKTNQLSTTTIHTFSIFIYLFVHPNNDWFQERNWLDAVFVLVIVVDSEVTEFERLWWFFSTSIVSELKDPALKIRPVSWRGDPDGVVIYSHVTGDLQPWRGCFLFCLLLYQIWASSFFLPNFFFPIILIILFSIFFFLNFLV